MSIELRENLYNYCAIMIPHFFAREMNGKRVETIEIDTKKWVIVQSRAVCNGTSKHHDDIINLMKKNMPKLKRLAQAS